MKLAALTLCTITALFGCDGPPMSNDRIISESKKCEDAGMYALPIRQWNGLTIGIMCEPRKQVRP